MLYYIKQILTIENCRSAIEKLEVFHLHLQNTQVKLMTIFYCSVNCCECKIGTIFNVTNRNEMTLLCL